MNDRLEMLGLIVALILSDTYNSTIENLSKTCELPILQMRKNIGTLFSNKLLFSHLSPTPEIDENDANPKKTAERFLSSLVNGTADNEEIYLADMEHFIDDYQIIPITSVETGYISNEYPKLIQNQRIGLFETKDTIDSIPKVVVDKQDKIQEAISQKKQIEFSYKSPQFDIAKIICSPVAVIQNLTTHILYLKDTNDNYYRIDRIKSSIKILRTDSDIDQYNISPFQKYFWGTEYKEHGKPIHVKLQISAGTTNIIRKIQNDTILRAETRHLYQDGEYYYYEDDILGIPDFRRWLRSYGSSITVLEPQSLIDEVTNSATTTLSYYKKIESLKL